MTIVNHLGLSLVGTTGCFLYNFPILHTLGEHFVGHNSYNAFYSNVLQNNEQHVFVCLKPIEQIVSFRMK